MIPNFDPAIDSTPERIREANRRAREHEEIYEVDREELIRQAWGEMRGVYERGWPDLLRLSLQRKEWRRWITRHPRVEEAGVWTPYVSLFELTPIEEACECAGTKHFCPRCEGYGGLLLIRRWTLKVRGDEERITALIAQETLTQAANAIGRRWEAA